MADQTLASVGSALLEEPFLGRCHTVLLRRLVKPEVSLERDGRLSEQGDSILSTYVSRYVEPRFPPPFLVRAQDIAAWDGLEVATLCSFFYNRKLTKLVWGVVVAVRGSWGRYIGRFFIMFLFPEERRLAA